ncbi:BTAD domain-containing putative transcriptional regulator [Nonomuraea sp. NPDC050643]|uniref:BTAD domain-containing putative transcriptional regulator n=1 Tax=Nonomuraea sp. NPDC050643 TaxID=3155660 RepID=UPI0033DE0E0A
MVSFGVLGPLTADNDQGPVRLKGPRHRAVLARLLVARGRVVPVSWLIDDLWDAPGEGALGAVQTFVGALRKALEPDRPPRTLSRLLVTAPPGYALRAEPGAVDAWRFEAAVTRAGGSPPEAALALLDEALGWWRGPAYAEFAGQDWARGEAARLDELRLLAVERRAEAALGSGRAAESVADLEAHVAGHPLREDGWRLLALALYRGGRQGDALGVLRRARVVLREELGVDPGQGLRDLEAGILAQSPHLTARPPSPSGPSEGTAAPPPSPGQRAGGDVAGSTVAGGAFARSALAGSAFAGGAFVGRVVELGELERAAAEVVTAGRARLVLVSGAAGAGKTALAGALAERLEGTGWITARGGGTELPGAPSAWPWAQITTSLTAAGHPPTPEPSGVPAFLDVPASSGGAGLAARFRRHRRIVAHLAEVAAKGPVLLVLDDLHWADEETLALLTTLATDLGAAPVLVVGTYRSTEISGGLAEALGRVARAEPVRLYLGGLAAPEVRELVRGVTGREVGEGDARAIHARSGGNPFFARELARVWESEGEAALHTVPAGVRDVIRHRLGGLSETARAHLRQAAILGQEVDLEVLIALAGDEEAALDSVESALLAGFLVELDADRLRFAHALVHETLYDDIPRARRARRHAVVAELLERMRPGDVEAIAHHCLRAEGRAGAARTAHYARAAAERAERRFAPHEAARLWRATVTALDSMGVSEERDRTPPPPNGAPGVAPEPNATQDKGPDPRPETPLSDAPGSRPEKGPDSPNRVEAVSGEGADSPAWRATVPGEGLDSSDRSAGSGSRAWLEAVMGMVRALAVVGELGEARRHRARAVDVAEAIGDPVLTAAVIGAFDVPAIWTANDDPALSARLATAAERTLAALPDGYEAERARLLITIAMERRADPGGSGDRAAREAEAIARRRGDLTLLAYALNGRYMQTFHRAGLAPRRAAIGEELLGLASGRDGLVTFEVLGHLILVQARAALADLEAADRHAAAADLLAERYDLPLVGVFTGWYAALRLAVTGPADEARAACRAAAARLTGTGMAGVEEGILPLALLCIDLTAGETLPPKPESEEQGSRAEPAPKPEPEPGSGPGSGVGGGWGSYGPWVRAVVEGREAGVIPDSPRDLLFEARTCLHARLAIKAGDRAAMERLHATLLPAEEELAGAGSGLVTLEPVALYLGHLAAALGWDGRAAEHYRTAEAVAAKAGASRWAAAARAARRELTA